MLTPEPHRGRFFFSKQGMLLQKPWGTPVSSAEVKRMVYIILSALPFHCVNGHNLMWLEARSRRTSSPEPASGPLDAPSPHCRTSGKSFEVGGPVFHICSQGKQLCSRLAGVCSGEVESGAGCGGTLFSLL